MELAYANAVTCNGILYLVGYRDGGQYFRRSADGGSSWLTFSDGGTERLVGSSDAGRAGLVKMETQGRPLMAVLPRQPELGVHVSHDDGETWTLEGTV